MHIFLVALVSVLVLLVAISGILILIIPAPVVMSPIVVHSPIILGWLLHRLLVFAAVIIVELMPITLESSIGETVVALSTILAI
jgi:hypothetical protein